MKTVMIVDDNKNIVLALKIRIEASNYAALVAYDIPSAKKILDTEKPDVVILDLTLADGSGFEVAQYIRSNRNMKKLPIIFLTASKLPEQREQASQYEYSRYFEKPYESSDLLAAIDEITQPNFKG